MVILIKGDKILFACWTRTRYVPDFRPYSRYSSISYHGSGPWLCCGTRRSQDRCTGRRSANRGVLGVERWEDLRERAQHAGPERQRYPTRKSQGAVNLVKAHKVVLPLTQCQGEIAALEQSGRLPASAYKGATMYTTLSPCDMCTGACVLYKVERVVIGENTTFVGGEEYLKQRGIHVVVLGNSECQQLMQKFIEERPEVWYVMSFPETWQNSRQRSESQAMLNRDAEG